MITSNEIVKVDPVSISELGQILKRRLQVPLAMLTGLFAASAVLTIKQSPQYESTRRILLNNQSASAIDSETKKDSKPEDLSTEIEILRSKALLAGAASELKDLSINISAEEMVKNLSISQAGDADILMISDRDRSPERAKAVLDILGKTYVNDSLERRGTAKRRAFGAASLNSARSLSSNAIKFIHHRLPLAQNELNEAGNAIRQFQQTYGIVDLQLEAISRAQGEISPTFDKIPVLGQNFTELERRLEVKSEEVNNFLSRLQELQIAQAQDIAPWQFLEPPFSPEVPVSPNVHRNLVLGLITGGLLGVGMAILLDRMDLRVRQVEELKLLTGLPILGTLPKVKQVVNSLSDHPDEEFQKYLHSSFTEPISSLAINLRHLIVETGKVNVLAITSASSAEGKTTVTYNLGLMLAELGLRVLVVDGDMQKSKIHKLAGKCNATGLSTLLCSDRSWSDFVRPGESENLDLLTAGPTPPNAFALLDSEKMKHLLVEWRQVYDYVLVDTPTVGSAHTQFLAKEVDAAILVTGIGRGNRKAITRAMDVLERVECNLAGLVANFIDKDDDHYAFFYNDYDYSQVSVHDSEEKSVEGKV